MKSMTGYGRAQVNFGRRRIICEIRTINSKQLDLYGRLPEEYKILDNDFRSRLSEILLRGKIEYTFYIEKTGKGSAFMDEEAVERYIEGLKYLSRKNALPLEADKILPLAVQLSVTPQLRTSVREISSGEKTAALTALEKAIKEVERTRLTEGTVLKNDLLAHIKIIENTLSKKIIPFEKKRMPALRERLTSKLQEMVASASVQIDSMRFEQEMFFYIEKFDITEEVTRLKQHCEFFKATCKEAAGVSAKSTVAGVTVAIGKKLGFIAQEIGREINTIGSKANDAVMQQTVVVMKDELEKIKEQLANIL
jgi:uncharacterized protein (TIGR00255 family)